MNNAGKISFLPLGNYDETQQYHKLDMVYFPSTNATYVAKKDTKGRAPDTEDWEIFCSAPPIKQNQIDELLDNVSLIRDENGLISINKKYISWGDEDV